MKAHSADSLLTEMVACITHLRMIEQWCLANHGCTQSPCVCKARFEPPELGRGEVQCLVFARGMSKAGDSHRLAIVARSEGQTASKGHLKLVWSRPCTPV